MLHQLKLLLYFLMSQFVPLLSFLVKRRRIEFCKRAGCCATLTLVRFEATAIASILLTLSEQELN